MYEQQYGKALPALCIIRYVAGMLTLLMLITYVAYSGIYIGLIPLVPYSAYLVYAFYLVLRALRDDTGHYQQGIGMNLYLMDIHYVVMILILLIGPLSVHGPLVFLLFLNAEFNTSFVAAIWIEMKMQGHPDLLKPLMDPASYRLVKNIALTAKTCTVWIILIYSNPHMAFLFFGYLIKPCTLLLACVEAFNRQTCSDKALRYTLSLTLAEVIFYATCGVYGMFQLTSYSMVFMALSVASNHLIPDVLSLNSIKSNKNC